MSIKNTTPPIHMTRRQAIWAAAGALVFDFVAFRILLPWLMSQPSTVALGVGILGVAALVAGHIDIIWCLVEPAPPVQKVLCDFCRKMVAPEDITSFERQGKDWNSCNSASCRVSLSKVMTESLVAERRA